MDWLQNREYTILVMRRSEFPYPNDSGKGLLTLTEITIKKNVLLRTRLSPSGPVSNVFP